MSGLDAHRRMAACILASAEHELNHTETLVLQVLAFHANRSTGLTYAAVSRLSALTGKSESSIKRATKRLIQLGLIEQMTRSTGRRAPRYIAFPKVDSDAIEALVGGTEEPLQVDEKSRRGVAHDTPRPDADSVEVSSQSVGVSSATRRGVTGDTRTVEPIEPPLARAREADSGRVGKSSPDSDLPSKVVAGIVTSIDGSALTAEEYHDRAHAALANAGFLVEREVEVSDRGDGKPGRIDLVLDGWLAVELDRVSPRKKSQTKVTLFGAGLVICRETSEVWVSPGEAELVQQISAALTAIGVRRKPLELATQLFCGGGTLDDVARLAAASKCPFRGQIRTGLVVSWIDRGQSVWRNAAADVARAPDGSWQRRRLIEAKARSVTPQTGHQSESEINDRRNEQLRLLREKNQEREGAKA